MNEIGDLLLEQWLRRRNSGELKWKTKDGKEIPIKDMTDEHLENAIRSAQRFDESSCEDLWSLINGY